MGKDGDTGTRWVENQNFGETQNFSDPKFFRPKIFPRPQRFCFYEKFSKFLGPPPTSSLRDILYLCYYIALKGRSNTSGSSDRRVCATYNRYMSRHITY